MNEAARNMAEAISDGEFQYLGEGQWGRRKALGSPRHFFIALLVEIPWANPIG